MIVLLIWVLVCILLIYLAYLFLGLMNAREDIKIIICSILVLIFLLVFLQKSGLLL